MTINLIHKFVHQLALLKLLDWGFLFCNLLPIHLLQNDRSLKLDVTQMVLELIDGDIHMGNNLLI